MGTTWDWFNVKRILGREGCALFCTPLSEAHRCEMYLGTTQIFWCERGSLNQRRSVDRKGDHLVAENGPVSHQRSHGNPGTQFAGPGTCPTWNWVRGRPQAPGWGAAPLTPATYLGRPRQGTAPRGLLAHARWNTKQPAAFLFPHGAFCLGALLPCTSKKGPPIVGHFGQIQFPAFQLQQSIWDAPQHCQ